jgi:hypothetical protein
MIVKYEERIEKLVDGVFGGVGLMCIFFTMGYNNTINYIRIDPMLIVCGYFGVGQFIRNNPVRST